MTSLNFFQTTSRLINKGPSPVGVQLEKLKDGHFAAWEEPELFAAELRAAFRSLRPDP